MASSLPSEAKSGTNEEQVKLLFVLKEQLDLVYKQLNCLRGVFKSVDRFNCSVRGILHDDDEHNQASNGQLLLTGFIKFERKYRIWKKRLYKLDRKMSNVDLNDKIYDLYKSLICDESTSNRCSKPIITPTINTPDNGVCVNNSYSENGDKLEASHAVTSNSSQFSKVDTNTRVTRQQKRISTLTSVSRKSVSKMQIKKKKKVSLRTKKTLAKDKAKIKKVISFVNDGSGRFECMFEGCSASYATMGGIQKHIQILHTKETPLLHCDWEGCNYSTKRNNNLQAHRIVHTGERPYKCPDCDQAFRSTSNLSRHKLIHQNERRFKCEWQGCEYSSYCKQILKKHQVVHTSDRPFKCALCEQTFRSASNLSQHKSKHQTSKDHYKCSFEGCGYSTNINRSLKLHLAVHSAERRFQCVWPGCGQAFKSASYLGTHKRIHQNQRRYKCSWTGCSYAANLTTHLKTHEKLVHAKKATVVNTSNDLMAEPNVDFENRPIVIENH